MRWIGVSSSSSVLEGTDPVLEAVSSWSTRCSLIPRFYLIVMKIINLQFGRLTLGVGMETRLDFNLALVSLNSCTRLSHIPSIHCYSNGIYGSN